MWYCLKRRRRYKPAFGLVVGRWYEGVRESAMEQRIVRAYPRAYVRVDDEEVEVPLGNLMVRDTKPDYSYAYNMESMQRVERGEPGPFDMSWIPVCPEGHQGPTTKMPLPETHDCKGCGKTYPIRTAG